MKVYRPSSWNIYQLVNKSWIIRKRINAHIDYADGEAEYTHPYLLLVAGNENTEKRIIKMSTDLIWDSEPYTTTEERLLSGKKEVWLLPQGGRRMKICTTPCQ